MSDAGDLTVDMLIRRSYGTAEAKGFHEPQEHQGIVRDSSPTERLALVHTEVSEAVEALRANPDPAYAWFRDDGKPEGVPSELADIVIRVCEFAGVHGIDLAQAIVDKMDFNDTRTYRHGGKHL